MRIRENNIFELGVLVQVERHIFGNSKKVPKEKIEKITNKKLSKWVKSNKNLIDKKALEEYVEYFNAFRNVTAAYSLPCPLRGVFFVPYENINEMSEKLDKIIEDSKSAVDRIVDKWDEYIEAAKEELSSEDLFDEKDYPRDIRSKFGLHYYLYQMTVPGKIGNVNPALMKKANQEFTSMIENMKNEGIVYLREGFLAIVNSITKIITGLDSGERTRVNSNALEKIENFFQTFKTKNIFGDNELQKLIEETREIVFGIEVEDLKDSARLRKVLAKDMEKISQSLTESIETFKVKRTVKL